MYCTESTEVGPVYREGYMRTKIGKFTVVVTEITTESAGTLWYSAFYNQDEDGDRSLRPAATREEALSAVKRAVDSYRGPLSPGASYAHARRDVSVTSP